MRLYFLADPRDNRRFAASLIVLVLLLPTSVFFNPVPLAHATNVPAWNPNVSCPAVLSSDHGVIGNHFNATTEGALETGGPFGVFATNQNQIGTTADLQPDLNPPCTYPNVNGTMAPTFVEIHGVSLTHGTSVESGATGGKCGTKYQGINGGGSYPGGKTFCTAYGVFQDTSEYIGNCETTESPSPKICIRLEIDRDWFARGYCGAGTVCDDTTFAQLTVGQKIDVQGFVAWHPPSSAGHGYSSWELHPLTAWRFTPTSSLAANFSWTPTNPVQGQTITFSGSGSNGTTPYTFSWNFGDGTSGSGSQPNHSYSALGSYTVTLTVKDANGNSAVSSKTITIASTLSTSFTFSPANPSAGTSVTFTATANGGVSPYNFGWNFGDGGTSNGSPATHVFSTGGTYVVALTTTDSGGHTSSASSNVAVSSPDFRLAANPALLTIQVGQNSQSQIAVTSLSGFQGTVALTLSASSPGLTISLETPTLTLSAGQTKTDNLRVATSNTSPTGVYVITVQATSGQISHSLNVTVRVPDFSLAASPTTLSIAQGSSGSSTMTFQGQYGFQGGINTQLSVSPGGPNPTLNPNNPNLAANGTTSSVLTIQIPSNQAAGVYNVTLKATAGQLVHSIVVTIVIGTHSSSTSITCSPSTVVEHQAINCTATVNDTSTGQAIAPAGSVTFSETGAAGTFSPASCTLSSGSCFVTFNPAANGNVSISASYSGDSIHSGSASGPTIITVNLRSSSTALSCFSPVVVNQASTCTATISDPSPGTATVPSGSVAFSETGPTGSFNSLSCILSSGTCSVTFTGSSSGSALVVGSYGGDPLHFGSNVTFVIQISQRGTSTSVSCISNGVGYGQACTATVIDTSSGSPMTPGGSVSFSTNSTGSFDNASCNLVGTGTPGVASCSVNYTPIAIATHTITGSYSGDAIHLASQGSGSFSFGKNSTIIAISCSLSSVLINQATTCTATVTDTSIIPSSPSGTVNFASNGPGAFGGSPCILVSQNATSSSCQVTFTPSGGAGSQNLTAVYNGDSTHNGSTTSQPFALTVNLRLSSTSVSCSPSSVVVNQPTNCTAVVADSSGSGSITPSGTVLFSPGGSCTLVSGSCSVSTTPSSSGPLSVTANYGGDFSHASSSGGTSISVGNRTTSTRLNCSPASVTNNSATSCTVTVMDTDTGTSLTPSGIVTFSSNATGTFSPTSCNLAGSTTVGIATCAVNYVPSVTGSHQITGIYAGDASHLASGGSVVVTVVPTPPKSLYALVVSTDGKVSKLYQNGTLTLVGQPVTTALRSVAWKPDGSYALITGDAGVFIKYDGTSLTIIPTSIGTGFNFWTVAWKPDGSYALVAGSSGKLFKYDGVTVTVLADQFTSSIYSISWNPSGSLALLTGKGGLVLTYDGATVESLASGTTFDLLTSAWSPSGAYALIGGNSRTLLMFNGSAVSTVNSSGAPANNAIKSIAFNPAGTVALLVGDNGMVLSWNGSSITVLPVITFSWLTGVSWTATGTAYIVGGSGTVLTYSNGTLAKLATVPTTTTPYRAIAWKQQ